ncbi:TAXI family TRAP transporter solute-binding subunit [Maridesulfovibrio sp. FT414]|uniref:TAXI family TRAP transporter solute-binding subunit n=1 Tax=Maridesulfovibrio sp. FT414 TaxID=2979469 RepID=UPI003D809D2E
MKHTKLTTCLILFVALAFLTGANGAEAKWRSYGSSKSYSSAKSYSSYSKPTSKVQGSKSVSGTYSSSSQSGTSYSKPAEKSTKSSVSYSKPSKSTIKSTSLSPYSKPDKSSSTSTPVNSNISSSTSSTGEKAKATGSLKFDNKISNSQSAKTAKNSYTEYKDSKAKLNKTTTTQEIDYKNKKLTNKVRRTKKFSSTNDAYARSQYYSKRDWKAPSYTYNSKPSFGMWDSLCLWMMLDSITRPGFAETFYNHQLDPGIQEWRAEADQLAANNHELQEKLNQLDSKLKQMNGPLDTSFLPAEIPASIALAPEALAAISKTPSTLRFATASKSGNYNYFGTLIKDKVKDLDVNLINTSGSLENLDLLKSGEVDAAIVQSDAFLLFKKNNPKTNLTTMQTAVFPEAVQMIANRASGIKSVKDIDPKKHILYTGPKDSGTAITWESFCELDSSYKKIPTRSASYEMALDIVKNNDYAVMMFVSALNSDFLKKAEAMASSGSGLRLITVDDWDFNNINDSNGNKVYSFIKIPSEVYPALQKGWFWGKDIETIAVEAALVINPDWIMNNGVENLNILSSAVVEAEALMRSKIAAKGN